jgi:hypothetical protein
MSEIVALLNARTGITCTITHANYNAWPTLDLVAMTAQDITGAGHTALYTGEDLRYDLTLAANDTVGELAALITAKADYTAASLHADYDSLDTGTLTDIAAEDITSAISLEVSGITYSFDTTNASYDTYDELKAAIDALGSFMAVISPGTVGTDASSDLAEFTATAIDGVVSMDTAAGDVLLGLAETVAAEYGEAKTWLAANVPGSHGEVLLWPFNAYQELTTAARAALSAQAVANGITIGRSAQLYQRDGAGGTYINPRCSYEGGMDKFNILGEFMLRTAPTPTAADDHAKHIITWARVNGVPVSFLGHFSGTALDPELSIIDTYTKAIQKYGRYVPLSQMAIDAAAFQVRTAPYDYSPAWKNEVLTPAPSNRSNLYQKGRIIAGIHAATGHVDAMANTYPPLQAQKFGLRKAGETEWSAQRKLAFHLKTPDALDVIEITTWSIKLTDSGAGHFVTFELPFAAYPTIGDVIDAINALAIPNMTILTHFQCIRSLPSTSLEQFYDVSTSVGRWLHYYPAELNPMVGAVEHVVKLGQPKELWRK